ncbi:thiamine diphosphokinase [Postechiella marina]|uniref:Thiamine diphosphokinase n=1 Tax=Postechiella marina TaxID=943941 RepID=A0ABP8BYW2_9FLAO
MNKKVFLLLNGEPPKKMPNLLSYDIICATDGAYQFLEDNNITPNFINGDFDSVKKMPENIETIHTPNQNFTDFDKILKILFDRNYIDIDVFGASGQEQDHFLGNLNTALQWKSKLNLTFFDNYGCYFLADKHLVLKDVKEKTISLIPFPVAKGIITKGLQYALSNETLTLGDRIGTRNVAVENRVEITFKTGNLFVFINNK